MFTKDSERANERGQVGIGTLIVFIAMVLVAAIAAGVLINTAGLLQSKSQQTGQQASAQVTNQVQVINKIGNVNSKGNALSNMTLTAQMSPGASAIDLRNVTISYVSPGGSGTLTWVKTVSKSNFAVSTVKDNDNSISKNQVLNNPDDRANLHINTSALRLKNGQSATLRITTKSGATVTVRVHAPDSFSGKSAVSL